MAVRMKLDKAVLEGVTDTFKHIGDAADKLGEAARKITPATDSKAVREARRNMRIIGAAAWGSILSRIFRGRWLD